VVSKFLKYSSQAQPAKSRIVNGSDTGNRSFKIDVLDSVSDLGALVDEIAKVLPSNFAFATDLESVFALRSESLDRALKTNAEMIGWHVKNFAHFVRDTITVNMNVIDGGELRGNLGGKSLWQGMWDLIENVICCSQS
jgi:hypothetical protein